MSSRRRHNKSRSTQNKRVKKNAIQTYKLIDTIVQSLLFIYFLYGISADSKFHYELVLIILACIQAFSIAMNFTFSDSKMLQRQRFFYMIVLIIFCPVYYYIRHHVKEKVISIDQGYAPSIPTHLLLLLTVSMALTFWYIVICYREFRSMFGAINTGSERNRRQ
jgi:hypothetical protein